MRNSRIQALVIVVIFVAAACRGGDTTSEVTLEARWQCDVQRQTFDDMGDLDAELEARLTAAGLTRTDYDAFKEKLADSADLRIQVAEGYDAYCLP
jgi:hypothetical protein